MEDDSNRSADTIEELGDHDSQVINIEADFDINDIGEESMMERNLIQNTKMNTFKNKMQILQENSKRNSLSIMNRDIEKRVSDISMNSDTPIARSVNTVDLASLQQFIPLNR